MPFVADLLEEMGDPNSEIIRHSLLLDTDMCDGQFDCRRGLGNGGDGIGLAKVSIEKESH